MRARDLDTSNAASGLTSRCADRTPLACSMTGRLFNAVCSCSSTMSRLRARRACTMADGGGIGQRLRRREVLVSHRRDLGGTEEVEPAKGLPRRRIGRAMTWRSRRRWRHGRSSATGPAHPPAGAPAPAGRGDSRIGAGDGHPPTRPGSPSRRATSRAPSSPRARPHLRRNADGAPDDATAPLCAQAGGPSQPLAGAHSNPCRRSSSSRRRVVQAPEASRRYG
jgi:hypothetical protein